MVDIIEGYSNSDNKKYYDHLFKYLKSEKSVHKKSNEIESWIQTQASNYFLQNDTLFYDKRKPRKVIIEENLQNEILKDIHVDEDGTHKGVKKMHEQLKKQYFWRYCYKTISLFVQNCPSCSSQRQEKSRADSKTAENSPPWTNLHYFKLSPSDTMIDKQQRYLAIIFDPASFWISAATVSNSASDAAAFIFENITNFGVFHSCTINDVSQVEYDEIVLEFSKFTEDSNVKTDDIQILKADEERSSFCEYLSSSVEILMKYHPGDWWNRSTLLKWLYKMRHTTTNGKSPVNIMNFMHRLKFSPKQIPGTITNLRTSTCLNQPPEGKVSLNIRESVALTKQGSSPRRSVRHSRKKTAVDVTYIRGKNGAAPTESTIEAVKKTIAKNKEEKTNGERRKRGEYHRYTPELRESIAKYAIQNGVRNASKNFSSSLECSVSCSTVRNLIRSYHTFSPQIKEEIGRYATECGVEVAKNHYSEKLGKPISSAFIRKFRRLYLRMGHGNQPVTGVVDTKQGKTLRNLYCTSVREEMGKYASVHGVQAAISHFSEKLQCKVKESTVRKYRKLYARSSEASTNASQQQRSSPGSAQPAVQSSPQNVFNSEIGSYYVQNYSQYPVPQYGCQPGGSYSACTTQAYNMNQPVPPYPSYTSLPPPPQYQPSPAQLPAYSKHWNAVSGTQESSSESNTVPIPMLSNTASANNPAASSLDLAKVRETTTNLLANNVREFKKTTSRGRYASYSPQIRLQIGRFAAEKGCNEAVSYFKTKLGHEIPESTIRTLRDKYTLQQRNCESDVVALDTSHRGRPHRLGAYDATVQECLRQLKLSGEPVNVFVTIAAARQVLLEREPSLLEENGGPIKLTKYWAKSFLRRTGINKQVSSREIPPEDHLE